jgi:small subunit ribosomal protein S17
MAKVMTGIVASDKGNKTIVVSVQRRKTHPLYKKQYTSTKRYQAHDEKNEAKVGDKVTITETRPISASKHFVLSMIVEKTQIKANETVDKITAEEVEEPKETKAAAKTGPKKASKASTKPSLKEDK